MEFGRVTTETLTNIDFSLPKDDRQNNRFFNSKQKTKLFLGCAKWGRKDWVGKLYPQGTKEKDFLAHYVKHFNCIEMNATHYRVFGQSVIEKWRDTSSDGFVFCPKFTNTISHLRRLKNCQRETLLFIEQIQYLGDHLGPAFLQLHQNFGPKSFEDIQNYLQSLPKDLEVFLEVRHPEWFSDPVAYQELAQLCEENGIGWLITDAAGRRDVCHCRLTRSKAMVRFVGNSLHPSDYKRMDDWVMKMGEWISKGLEEIYFFMHQHDELYSPELIAYLIKEMNAKYKMSIPPLNLIDPDSQQELF